MVEHERATSEADAVEAARTTLGDAVGSHLVSDVPLGVLLSGGVDSTLVASLARRHGVEPHFLTVGFAEPRFDEAAAARATALRLGGTHHVVQLAANDVLALLPDAIAAMDQPTADGVNTYVITRAAAERGIKVLVSGLGGDELFGGYTTFRKAPFLAAHARRLAPFARLLGALGVGNVAQWTKIAGARDVGELRTAYLLQRARSRRARRRPALPADTWRASRAGAARSARCQALEVASSPSQLLHDADVRAANSVELRVPFLDLTLRLHGERRRGGIWSRRRAEAPLKALLHRLEPQH